jgi:penicillin-binding protein 1A
MTWEDVTRAVRRLLAGVGAAIVVAALGWATFYVLILRDLPDLEQVEDYRPLLTSQVLDRNGHAIGEFFEERRRLTPIDELPPQMIHAIVAAEDDSFFEHRGLDYGSILRAAWVNFWAGRTRQGASTITQQVAKSLLLTPERSYRRKLRDMILAQRIEERLAKDEILFLYLNQIYFGRGAYGIADAARSYFGKAVLELSVSECALLAGLPQRPSEYSPFVDPDAAERRRQYVLRRMHEVGYLDDAAYEEAVADLPVLAPAPLREDFAVAAYFTEEVRRYLFERLGGETVLRGGLTIQTTLDIELQRAASSAGTGVPSVASSPTRFRRC